MLVSARARIWQRARRATEPVARCHSLRCVAWRGMAGKALHVQQSKPARWSWGKFLFPHGDPTCTMPSYISLLISAACLLLPFQTAFAAAPDQAERAGVVPSCTADAYSCPPWMPSQREMRTVIADYLCDAADRGLIRPKVSRIVRAETSQVTCAALGQEPGSNFVCGGDMQFIGADGHTDVITFSPTMHRQDDGRYALYEGSDEHDNEVWRAPAPQRASKVCTGQVLR
ncbi:hypothetical protein [Xanthomonas hortorum]|uniref:hypothetical protein n=1 Tax=Xanthomonas hortorum TaxID=56454 RepID=UPI001F3FD326|nr:hypothetical protein [Xanthomonas hortorum]MCE4360568.1 hypothetical protein [Xanthomonas hortorum pv. taraxaci]